jgi:trehalose/maltose transport system substrate-binding protein
MLTSRRDVIAGLGFVFLDASLGCQRVRPEPVTIMFMDPEWLDDRPQRAHLSEEALRQFENETGIKVKHLPAPETSGGQLGLIRELLGEPDPPDVVGLDVVWPGLLDDALLDLKPFFGAELSGADANLVSSYSVNEKVVAVPYHPQVGVLYYRTDLLTEYGYHVPPQTWSELEKMAFRIQQGERAAGDEKFWGFVWPGAADEGLSCLALEWQASEGGGRIIEENRTISVNNENAIRAWQRAAHWIGWISPPGVTAYEELDTVNYFEGSGRAAFRLGWTSDYFLVNPAKSPIYGRMGVTSVPAGTMAAATLGGFGLGISGKSKHQREAIALVKFLVRKEAELRDVSASAELPGETALFRLPTILKAYSRSRPAGEPLGSGIVSRPSAMTGRNYEKASHAYAMAVHSVLTGKKGAPEAAADLEMELQHITGFPKGAPEPAEIGIRRTNQARP